MPSKRPWPRWLFAGICAALLLIVAALAYSVSSSGSAHRAACETHLSQISLALQEYHDQHGSFPPAYTLGPDGQPWHSWRVLILPQLGEEALYQEYDFDEPWNSDHNRTLVGRMPAAFGCPASAGPTGITHYLAIVGERTVWPGPKNASVARIGDGAANMLQLMEIGDSDVAWTEPRDLSVSGAWEAYQQPPPHPDGRHFSLCDGTVRFLKATISKDVLVRVINCARRQSMGPLDRLPQWLRADLPSDAVEWEPTTLSSESKTADVVASASMPLEAAKTQVWCATFQMVWDELRDQCGVEEVDLQPAIPMSDALNRSPFSKQALAPECVLLHAAMPGPEVDRRLRAEFAKRFPNAQVRIEDSPAEPRVLRMLAYLEKQLPFLEALERFPQPLPFGANETTGVESFGVSAVESEEDATPVLEKGLFVRDYVSDEDFIIELATRSQRQDRVIMARVAPLETLADAWSHVAKRIKTPHPSHDRPHLMSTERLQAPVLLLNLHREYEELQHGEIHSCQLAGNLPVKILLARQEIRFRLDENGATLLSLAEAEAMYLNGGPAVVPRRFIFDRPFLLALREGEHDPYFLAWIATTEVMQKK